MGNIFWFLISMGTVFCQYAFAQQAAGRVIDGTILPGFSTSKNYVNNPSARVSATISTATTSATLVRDTDTADRIDGVASFLCDTSAQDGFCEFDTYAIGVEDQAGTCEVGISYKGDGTLYRLRVTDGTTGLVDSSLLQNVSVWTTVSIQFTCGATRDVRLVQTVAGTSPAVNLGSVYLGRPRSATAAGFRTVFGSFDTASGSCTLWRTSGSFSGSSRTGVGDCTANLTAAFADVPSCACSAQESAAHFCAFVGGADGSAVRFRVWNTAGSLVDGSSGSRGLSFACFGN